MTTPWNTFANDNRNTQAWQAAPQNGAYTAPANQGYAPTQTLPPAQQFPAAPQFDYGYPQQFPAGQPPTGPNRTALLISLIAAAVLLIGGGVAAFLLLTKDKSAGPVTPVVNPSTSNSQTISSPDNPTTTSQVTSDDPTSDDPTTSDEPTSDDPTSDDPSTGAGDEETATQLVQTWVDLLNEGDVSTASALVCEAQRDDFAAGSAPTGTLQVEDVRADGENYVVTISLTEDPTQAYELTMRPTNTGYFLICDSPLSENDLNW